MVELCHYKPATKNQPNYENPIRQKNIRFCSDHLHYRHTILKVLSRTTTQWPYYHICSTWPFCTTFPMGINKKQNPQPYILRNVAGRASIKR